MYFMLENAQVECYNGIKISFEDYFMIKICNLNKVYKSKKRKKHRALKDISTVLPDAGLVFVLGKSGSGKSTLLNLIGGLDSITSGKIEVDGNDISSLSAAEYANYRNSHIGFIFQDYHLIDELTVYENIKLALDLFGEKADERVHDALARVGLSGYETRFPSELSGGEQQRVAIARAIVKKPRIILADEPTGNLDTNTARQIVEILKELARDCLILIVSHNVNDANKYADRIIELSHGEIISDRTKNPNFADEVVLDGGALVYPQGLQLSDSDIELINAHHEKPLVKKTDKFLVTSALDMDKKRVKIEKKSLNFGNTMGLSGKFLKSKALAISFSAFMVAVIMVIMALAQTIINFDSGRIIKEEMDKQDSELIYLTKILSDEQKAMLSQVELISDCYPEIYEDEIQAFRDAGYSGRIYEVLKYDITIYQSQISAGHSRTIFTASPYILESIGTIIVDEDFLIRRFGEITYLAKAEEFHPTGVIITDYLADTILRSGRAVYATDYDSLIGEYHWGNSKGDLYSLPSRGYINGIIYTGYKEKYKDMLEKFDNGEYENYEALMEEESFSKLVEDIYSSLGFCYSLNPNFKEDALTNPAWEMCWHYTLSFNHTPIFYSQSGPQIRTDELYGIELGDNQVLMNMDKYNEWFGTSYNKNNVDSFKAHTTTVSHYKHFDIKNPCFTEDIEIVGLFVNGRNNYGGTFVAGDRAFELFQNDFIFTTGLLFEGNENLDTVIDVANELNFDQHMAILEGIHTMTKAVDVFIPIFELIAIFLCIGVVFILVNFSSKMINDKMHEIGILKALGAKNSSIGVIFGLQVALIAILTCILATAGYYFFIDLANDVLIESLMRLAPQSIVLDLDFLTFQSDIALTNCALIALLTVISLVVPFIKIRFIEPVKIIKSKE